jgi:WD40 repeat protein
LFARLAVYELIADPRLLTAGMARSRGQLLQGTHRHLFGRALRRLSGHDDRYPVLMRALSVARGRGLPEADGIWAVVAAALAPGSCPAASPKSGAAAWASAISGLLSQAAAYVVADISTGRGGDPAGPGTLYRLAHRTFVEYFGGHPIRGPDDGDSRRLAAGALLHAAEAAAASPGRMPDYLVKHLSGHAAEAGMWDDLAGLPHVLDHVDPDAVTADAVRTLFGRRTVPPSVAGIIGAREILARASPADRSGLRQLATTIHSPRRVIGEPTTGWGIAAAQAGHSTVHVRLNGHTSTVNKVLSLTLSGRVVLASCGDDGTIRLWDPATATPVGVPMKGHTSTIEDICVLPVQGGRTLLAGAGEDGTVRLWDPATGRPAGPLITGHTGHVRGICVAGGHEPGQAHVLASAGLDGTVRLWDGVTGRAIGEPLVRSAEAVSGLARCAAMIGDCVTVHGDGTVRTWTAATATLRAVRSPPDASAIATLDAAGQLGLLTGDVRGRVHLTDLLTGRRRSSPLRVDRRAVLALCPLPGQPRTARAAAAGGSGVVSVVTVFPGSQLKTTCELRGPGSPIRALCAITGSGSQELLAAAANDATIWLWDLATTDAGPRDAGSRTASVRSRLTGHDGRIWSLAEVSARPGRPPLLASAGADHTVRMWDPAAGRAVGQPLTGHCDQVRAVIAADSQDGRVVLVSGGHDGTVRLWDPVTGMPGAVIPLGIEVHALLQQRQDCASLERTGGGATITVGLRTGILALDLHSDLFQPARRRSVRRRSMQSRSSGCGTS